MLLLLNTTVGAVCAAVALMEFPANHRAGKPKQTKCLMLTALDFF